jgi:hypothetical protein
MNYLYLFAGDFSVLQRKDLQDFVGCCFFRDQILRDAVVGPGEQQPRTRLGAVRRLSRFSKAFLDTFLFPPSRFAQTLSNLDQTGSKQAKRFVDGKRLLNELLSLFGVDSSVLQRKDLQDFVVCCYFRGPILRNAVVRLG